MLGGLSFILGLFSLGLSAKETASRAIPEKMELLKKKNLIEELGDKYNPDLEESIFSELKKEHPYQFLTKYPPLKMCYLCHLEMNKEGYESFHWVMDARDKMLDPYKDHLCFYSQDFTKYDIGSRSGTETEFHIFGLSGKIIPQFTTLMDGMNPYTHRGKRIVYHFYGDGTVSQYDVDPQFTLQRTRLRDTLDYIMVNMYCGFFGTKFPVECSGMKRSEAIKRILMLSNKANVITYENMYFHSFDEYDKNNISGTVVFNGCPAHQAYKIYADQKYNPNVNDFISF